VSRTSPVSRSSTLRYALGFVGGANLTFVVTATRRVIRASVTDREDSRRLAD
jgi:hypothetical protein